MELIAIYPDTPTITTIVNFYSLLLLQLGYVRLRLVSLSVGEPDYATLRYSY